MYRFRDTRTVQIVMVLAFLVGMMLVSFAGSAQMPKDVLVFASTDSITTWDPSAAYSTEATYMPNIYEGLLHAAKPGSKEAFEPLLATDWDVTDNGLTWTFHLRKGVKFHDGTPFNAQAVKFSIERTMKLGTGASFIFAAIDTITVIDDYTVQFHLKYTAPFAAIVASANGAWIMSPQVAEHDVDGDMGRAWLEEGHEAGTGPYTLDSWKPDESIVLKKFNNYWGKWDGDHISTIIVKIVKEAGVQLQMLLAGEADLVTRVPPESIADLENNKSCEVLKGPSFMNYALHLNTTKPPLDNILVRQAISYAISYQDLITVSVAGWATQAVGAIPYGEFGYDSYLYQYKYNLDKAKKLMAMAGYPDGIDRKLVFTYAAENTTEKAFAPIVKEDLAKIGIDVEIRPMIWTSQWELAKGDPTKAQDMFALLWWPTFNDAHETLYSLWHTEENPYWNLSYYQNDEYDQLVAKAYRSTGTDPEMALGLYSTAQQILINEAPSIFLFDLQRGVYKRANLAGYIINPSYPRVPFFYYMHK